MTRVPILIIAIVAGFASAQDMSDDGMPFGRIDDADIDRLQEFAATHGFDLKGEMAQVYSSGKPDEDALARVFVFSRRFEALDKNARTYGQII